MAYPRTGSEIREAFLGFFEARGHERVPSDSLVPAGDPTLLFTGAGMNQFKNEFLGRGRKGLKRAATAQKCLRVPDLENVGRTPRHHTFFEMLGNFSFGDYFKAEAIPWEWEFFTGTLGWDAERLLVTVYQDDDEAFGIWHEAVGLPVERIYRFGEKENFWPAEAPSKGPDGPCGPCSEIYFDQEPGGPLPPREGLSELPGRFLEVGNLVFTQFDRRGAGNLEPLPQKNIDVGLGLERIAAVAQGAANNFETDLFRPLLETLETLSGRTYGREARDDVHMRRIADHARAVFFCIADGAAPGREGRGYVVRKILRRAVRDGIELGLDEPFLAALLDPVRGVLEPAYPEIGQQAGTIETFVGGEEERFRELYQRGIRRLEDSLGELKRNRGATVFPGELAFELHDTYGFPADIAQVIVEENGFSFDHEGFSRAMEGQRERARRGSSIRGEVFAENRATRTRASGAAPTHFLGWDQDACPARVAALLRGEETVESLKSGEAGAVILDRTPFYARGGGQVGDRGVLLDSAGRELFTVEDTRAEEGIWFHLGTARGPIRVGDTLEARVDAAARRDTEAHHTATHLLQAALKEILGDHVHQAGSLVAPDRLRFDFTHSRRMTSEEIRAVEERVQGEILAARPVDKRFTTLKKAREEGVTALFGEKYGEKVRVVEVPGFSRELCGGTHAKNTGALGPFLILGERALAAGVRRIEALAGRAALAALRDQRERLQALEHSLKVPAGQLLERVEELRRELQAAKKRRAAPIPDARTVARALREDSHSFPGGPACAWQRLEGADAGALRSLADKLQKEDGLPGVVLLGGGDQEALPFVVLCGPDSGFRAGDLARRFGALVGGGGGGRPDFAQGRGRGAPPAEVEEAVQRLFEALRSTPA